MTLLAVVAVPLAGIGFIIYLGVRHPSAQLAGALVVALATIGQVRGWMHGMSGDVVAGLGVLYLVGSPVYWFGGKRRLIAVLTAWGAGDGTEP